MTEHGQTAPCFPTVDNLEHFGRIMQTLIVAQCFFFSLFNGFSFWKGHTGEENKLSSNFVWSRDGITHCTLHLGGCCSLGEWQRSRWKVDNVKINSKLELQLSLGRLQLFFPESIKNTLFMAFYFHPRRAIQSTEFGIKKRWDSDYCDFDKRTFTSAPLYRNSRVTAGQIDFRFPLLPLESNSKDSSWNSIRLCDDDGKDVDPWQS